MKGHVFDGTNHPYEKCQGTHPMPIEENDLFFAHVRPECWLLLFNSNVCVLLRFYHN